MDHNTSSYHWLYTLIYACLLTLIKNNTNTQRTVSHKIENKIKVCHFLSVC